MNKKRIFAAICAVSLMFSAAPISASAATVNEVDAKVILEDAAANFEAYDMQVKDLATGEEKTVEKSSYYVDGPTMGSTTDSFNPASIARLRGRIQGSDDRVKITDTKKFPYSAICYILIQYPNGNAYIGTAWMYSKNTAITAGHCVYSKADGGFPESITVIPGANGSEAPFGRVQATKLHCPKGYTEKRSSNYDFGIIELDSNIGEKTGYFGISWTPTTLAGKDTEVTVTGYPGEKSKTLWSMTGKISESDNYRYYYQMDTTGGQSGCPVYLRSGINYRAVAIHTTGSYSSNGSTRFNKTMFDYLAQFRK